MLGYVYKFKIKNVFLLVLVVSGALYFVQFLFLSEVRHPVIVWWTPFMGDHERMITCSKYTCLLSKDRTHVNNKNLQAFLFYGSLFKYEDTPIPKSRIWAVFHEESPRNVALFLYQRTYDVFDITATFSRYSDFPLTLQYLENLTMITDNRYLVSLYEKNRLLDSIAPVLYVQSDCDTPVERDAYIAELMKHIQVDSFGACLNNKHFPKGIADVNSMDLYNDKLLHFIAKYKFVLAFENAICDDYITEKLWRPLVVGSVPVYLGSPSVELVDGVVTKLPNLPPFCVRTGYPTQVRLFWRKTSPRLKNWQTIYTKSTPTILYTRRFSSTKVAKSRTIFLKVRYARVVLVLIPIRMT
ncbi:alpha-(1,3)-fucosyltransferase 10 isoform X2 [Zophobas morio]|uniref:alpha-(1,3)-fucosyltransferase 10 isoform X2 n=1 Tax=Zophobas morio TaxID=2755281 RepID=UPI003082DC63